MFFLKWYGVKNIKWQNKIKNLKLRNKLSTRFIGFRIENKINFNFSRMLIHVPQTWKINFLKIKNKKNFVLCHICSDVYFFYLPCNVGLNTFYFDQYTNVLFFNILYKNIFFNIYWSFFKNIFLSFNNLFFKRLKFKGKGYYIYKNYRNTIATQMGHSHMSRLFNYNVGLKFISKTLVLIYGLSKLDILRCSNNFYFKKPINIFTGRGIRFSRQIVYKKTGKLSTYR